MDQISKRPPLNSPNPKILIVALVLLSLLAVNNTSLYRLSARTRPQTNLVETRPLFSLPSGRYVQSEQLELNLPSSTMDKMAQIIFTIDGGTPIYSPNEQSGAIYTQPIYLDASYPAVVVVKARLLFSSGELGPVVSQTFFMNIQEPLPLVSLVVEPDDFWNQETGIYTNPIERGSEWERPAQVTYVSQSRQTGFQIDAGIRIHGQFSREYAKKSLRLYFRQEYGANRLIYPLFPGSDGPNTGAFKRLVLHAGGQDASQIPTNWTLIRNQLMANLAEQTNSLSTRSQPVLLFVNGEPWGLYYWRERIDPFWLAEELGADTAIIVDTPARRLENPADTNFALEQWDQLTDFVDNQDMTDPANYAYITTQVDIANFIDYSLLQIYSANFDWPFTNIKQFRSQIQGGRWQWVIWDNDLSLGLKPWSDVTQNTLAQALDPDYTAGTSLATNGRDTILLRRLLQNEGFSVRFLSRADELLNTTLAPEVVISQIDGLAAAIEPAIGFENGRWDESNPADEWAANVEQLRDFARRRPDIMRQQFVETFNLPGTAQVQFNQPQEGGGSLAVNDRMVMLPNQGHSFQGSELVITAVPDPGFQFAGWESPTNAYDNPLIFTITDDQAIIPRFEPASPDALRPGDVRFGQVCIQAESAPANWFQLQVNRQDGVDLRGWRLTDNDSKTATDEGSLIFSAHPALANVPEGTTITIVADSTGYSNPTIDDLDTSDGKMRLFVSNGVVDGRTDPGFKLNYNDNLVLLAPGLTLDLADEQGVAFITIGGNGSHTVTPSSFGVLADGVWSETASCDH